MGKSIGGNTGSGGSKSIGGNTGSGGSKSISGNTGSSSSNGDCFVATATFGSPLYSEIQVLRQWRDNKLRFSKSGRKFISWYYDHGPKLASFIEKHPMLKRPVRVILKAIINLIK